MLGVLSLSFASQAASPEKEAAGWAKWADFTSGVVDATKSERFDAAAVKAACKGATGVLIGQGFQFPYWAQNVMMACRAFSIFDDVDKKTDAGVDKGNKDDFFSGNARKILKREKKALCRDVASISKELGKATPIASEPRAQPLALELKVQMDMIAVKAECN
ncbi:MAG: hypothetical protein ABI588_00010 [Arenimonas sp.]